MTGYIELNGRRDLAAGLVPDTAPIQSARKTVLYVEDNLSNVRLLQQIISRRPHVDLLVAMQGRIGLEMAEAHQPDLILLDLHLPDISGEEVLRELRADPRTAATPIIILSADATPDQPERLIAQGANAYLTKPFKIASLLAAIDHLDAPPPPQPPADISTSQTRPIETTGESLPTENADSRPDPADEDEDARIRTFVHDMTNMLGVVLIYADLLASSQDPTRNATYLGHLGDAAEKAIELTKSLLPATDTNGTSQS